MNILKFLKETVPLIDNTIKKYIPRNFSKSDIIFDLNPPSYSHNIETLNKALADPVWDILDRGGKRWRAALFLLICETLGKDPMELLDFAIIPEIVHNGTLMIDDVEDSSELRREKPCTYKVFGIDIAINAGNAMYYLPLFPLIVNREKISPETLRDVYEIYVQEMINLSMGQAMDIAWHKGLTSTCDLTQEDYLQMCAYKTGTLARMAAKIAAVLAEANNDLVIKLGVFAENIGVAFQMQDDILDLTGKEFAEKKGAFGMDITEGKRTLLVIQTLKVASIQEKNRLIEILDMHTSDQKLRDEAITIIKKNRSIEYVTEMAGKMVEDSW
ncbi:polyprenyl synthetase family protein, partial [Candidatus Bathyarchaeota archaeon]|nr:polyprenyl synthetase family protein [Candidatus Bathyarchaeota archaeon]